jgi:uncharacterized protein
VDLHGITRQAIRAGTEGYGLKALEPVFGFERDAELRGAIGSMHRWQAWQDDGDPAHLDGIAGYNEDDCHSTRALFAWLLDRRPEAEAQHGIELASLAPTPAKEPSERQRLVQARTDAVRGACSPACPTTSAWTIPRSGRGGPPSSLLGYHSREAKPAYWALFARRERTFEQLRDEDPEAIAGLEVVDAEDLEKAWRWTLTFPAQDFKLGPGDADEPLAARTSTIEAVDEQARTVVVRRSKTRGEDPPRALAPGWPYGTGSRRTRSSASPSGSPTTASSRAGPSTPPRTSSCAARRGCARARRGCRTRRGTSSACRRRSAGSTRARSSSRARPARARRGRARGWPSTCSPEGEGSASWPRPTRPSTRFVAAIDEAADEAGVAFRGWKKASKPEDGYASARVVCAGRRPSEDPEEGGPFGLVAATAWHWAREDEREAVDVLFVDEAGQVALADAIAVAQAARSVVLLGDPQQLAHVSQGTHPPGVGRPCWSTCWAGRTRSRPTAGSSSPGRGACIPRWRASSRARCTTGG